MYIEYTEEEYTKAQEEFDDIKNNLIEIRKHLPALPIVEDHYENLMYNGVLKINELRAALIDCWLYEDVESKELQTLRGAVNYYYEFTKNMACGDLKPLEQELDIILGWVDMHVISIEKDKNLYALVYDNWKLVRKITDWICSDCWTKQHGSEEYNYSVYSLYFETLSEKFGGGPLTTSILTEFIYGVLVKVYGNNFNLAIGFKKMESVND